MTIYDEGLDRTAANFQPMTPISYLRRAALTYPDHPAVIHGNQRQTYAHLWSDCCKLASALTRRGIGRGDTVSVLLSNTPPMINAHFGVPMADGAVLHSINTRSDPASIAFQLDHAESRVLIVDREFSHAAKTALASAKTAPLVIDFDDPEYPEDAPYPKGDPIGSMDYAAFLAEGDPDFVPGKPQDEWDAIALNYTSGTTGNPKGVVCHHRGAALMAMNSAIHAGLGKHPVYLWTLPMFHCNGWCFPWTVTALAGTHVCLRRVEPGAIYAAIADHGVTHFCGAPIVLNVIANADEADKRPLAHIVEVMTAGAPPPPTVIEAMEEAGFRVTHVYGLTETYGPDVVCAWHGDWDALPVADRAALKARQGVSYPVQEAIMVADPQTLVPVPRDGETLGEVFHRGNIVMKGYLKNPDATREAFAGGWFHSGDLGVWHADGYVELKDRSKDIIISGGENISSIEIETVLYRHPAVLEAAVTARPDEKWGETPCAFVTLHVGAEADEAAIIAFCRDNMAHFKAPKTVVFGALPKTSTGKVQKFILREQAKGLGAD